MTSNRMWKTVHEWNGRKNSPLALCPVHPPVHDSAGGQMLNGSI